MEATKRIKKQKPDTSHFTAAVISPEYADKWCSHCGNKALIFNAQCFTEPLRPIITACKACIERRAGGAERVFVKTTWRGLAEVWKRNGRGVQPEAFKNAQKHRENGAESASRAEGG